MAAESLADVTAVASTDEMLRDMRGKLGAANCLLLPMTGTAERHEPAASIAAVLMKEDSYHVLWAGDVRAYLLEHGTMRPLTRDHVGVGIRSYLQRGIGLELQFKPETVSGSFSSRSTLLLCSQPLVRCLGERTIAEILLGTCVEEAAPRLIQEALIANAADNVTAVVIGRADTKNDA
jgi:type VI secretion system protein ImpM